MKKKSGVFQYILCQDLKMNQEWRMYVKYLLHFGLRVAIIRCMHHEENITSYSVNQDTKWQAYFEKGFNWGPQTSSIIIQAVKNIIPTANCAFFISNLEYYYKLHLCSIHVIVSLCTSLVSVW